MKENHPVNLGFALKNKENKSTNTSCLKTLSTLPEKYPDDERNDGPLNL